MLTKENLEKTLRVITQDSFNRELHTTVNAICEFIVRESISLVLDELNAIKLHCADLAEEIDILHDELNKIEDFNENKEEANGSKDRGVQESKRSPQVSNARTRNAKARKDDESVSPLNGS